MSKVTDRRVNAELTLLSGKSLSVSVDKLNSVDYLTRKVGRSCCGQAQYTAVSSEADRSFRFKNGKLAVGAKPLKSLRLLQIASVGRLPPAHVYSDQPVTRKAAW